MRHTCKVRSTSAAPSWWRGDCSRTRYLSLSCCNPTARWRWSWAGSRKWWFMTKAPKRPDICPKTASFTFSWESWRAPFTKSPCLLVRQCVEHECDAFLFFLFQVFHVFMLFVSLWLTFYCTGGRCVTSLCPLPNLDVAVVSLFAQQMSLLSTSNVHFLSQALLISNFLPGSETFSCKCGDLKKKRKNKSMQPGLKASLMTLWCLSSLEFVLLPSITDIKLKLNFSPLALFTTVIILSFCPLSTLRLIIEPQQNC